MKTIPQLQSEYDALNEQRKALCDKLDELDLKMTALSQRISEEE